MKYENIVTGVFVLIIISMLLFPLGKKIYYTNIPETRLDSVVVELNGHSTYLYTGDVIAYEVDAWGNINWSEGVHFITDIKDGWIKYSYTFAAPRWWWLYAGLNNDVGIAVDQYWIQGQVVKSGKKNDSRIYKVK